MSSIPMGELGHQKQAVKDYDALHKALVGGDPRDIQLLMETLTSMPERAGGLIIFLMAFVDVSCVAEPGVAHTLDKVLRSYR